MTFRRHLKQFNSNKKGGEKMTRILLTASLLILALSVLTLAQPFPTANRTTISNHVEVHGGNISTSNTYVTNIVDEMWGVTARYTNDNDSISGGVSTTNVINITNYGNSTTTFTLQMYSVTSNTTDPWTYQFYDSAYTPQSVTVNFSLAPAASTKYYLIVTAPSTANDGEFIQFSNYLTIQDTPANAIVYTGDNTSNYGGSLSIGAHYGAGKAGVTNAIDATHYWEITITGAEMQLTKTASVANNTSGATWGTTLVPGSTITYSIYYTNLAAGNANGVYIRDTIPANTTYVAGSMRYNTTSTYGGTTLNDGAADDAGSPTGYVDTGNGYVYFNIGTGASDGNPTSGGSGGTVAGHSGGYVFFRVTVD